VSYVYAKLESISVATLIVKDKNYALPLANLHLSSYIQKQDIYGDIDHNCPVPLNSFQAFYTYIKIGEIFLQIEKRLCW